MSLTPEERQEIINAACEKALLMLPEVVGNLMASHAALLEINKQFYKSHPEFATQKTLVQSVIAQLEGQQPTRDYKDLLADAVPVIQEQMKTVAALDRTTVMRPDRHLPNLSLSVEVDKNKPHGEL